MTYIWCCGYIFHTVTKNQSLITTRSTSKDDIEPKLFLFKCI